MYNYNLYIVQNYKLLLDEKLNFYGDNSLIVTEIRNLDNKTKKFCWCFELFKEKETDYFYNNVYYSLDGGNIFKRVHRFGYKGLFLPFILYIFGFNVADFIINIKLLVTKPALYGEEEDSTRRATLIINMVNILFILILTTLTTVKRKLNTLIYY